MVNTDEDKVLTVIPKGYGKRRVGHNLVPPPALSAASIPLVAVPIPPGVILDAGRGPGRLEDESMRHGRIRKWSILGSQLNSLRRSRSSREMNTTC